MSEQEKTAKTVFYTPEKLAQEQSGMMDSYRGKLVFASCRSGNDLAKRVVDKYDELLKQAGSKCNVLYLDNLDKRFSDSETCIRIKHNVSGYDVYLFQALLDPTSGLSIDQNYMAMLIAARGFKEHGAKHVTAVLPYLAYARQDKPTKFMREPVTAKLMADLSVEAGIDRIISWDPHCDQLRGFYGKTAVNMLESLTLFIDEFKRFANREDVIVVAPDAGASKFVTYFGRALGLKCAIASKYRPKPEQVVISEIIGDFAGKKKAIILDDMISGGGTIDALIRKVCEEKKIEEIYLGASHNLCVGQAYERLSNLNKNFNLKEVVTTNSIPQTEQFKSLPFMKICCLSNSLSRTINRIHYNQSVSEVFYNPE